MSPALVRRFAVPSEGTAPQPRAKRLHHGPRPKRVWVTGASGFLGTQLLSEFEGRHWEVTCLAGRHPIPPGRHQVLTGLLGGDADALVAAARHQRPDAIVHAAAATDTGWCERHPEEAHRINVLMTRDLAEAARAAGAHLVFTSTDLVFDGGKPPYVESDTPRALMVYGRTKVAAEDLLHTSHLPATVCRVALMFGPRAAFHQSCLTWMLEGLAGERPLTLFEDEYRTPADVRHVARALAEIVARRALGVFHLGGPERVSRVELGQRVASAWGLPAERITTARLAESPLAAARPADVSLVSERAREELGYAPPPLAESLADLAAMFPDGDA